VKKPFPSFPASNNPARAVAGRVHAGDQIGSKTGFSILFGNWPNPSNTALSIGIMNFTHRKSADIGCTQPFNVSGFVHEDARTCLAKIDAAGGKVEQCSTKTLESKSSKEFFVRA
jgi:hypothetical protein